MLSKYGFDTTSARSLLMSKIKSTGTKPELLLRKALWHKGFHFRINNKTLPGNPDLSVKKYKLVIFIDGEFWHGYNWNMKKLRIKSNKDYWIKKIESNIERDKKINQYYLEHKWIILRFWEQQLLTSLENCVAEISQYYGFHL